MPARLNVIMIESAPTAGSARRMAEDVVGELIGLPGIDLALVQSLTGLSETSTDKLTLEGITGDTCVLDWQSPEAIVSSLNAVGFAGRRSPHPHDLEAASSTNEPLMRRIYAFQLSRFSNAKELCTALSELRKVREVRTFSLLALVPGTQLVSEDAVPSGPSQRLSAKVSPAKFSSQPIAAAHSSSPQGPIDVHSSQPTSPSTPLATGIDLDALVNQLDDFDS